MSWTISTFIPLLATLFYGGIAIIVISSRPRTKPRLAFGIYLVAMFLWSLSAFLILSGIGNTLTWFKELTAAAILSQISIFYFVQFLFSRRRKWAILVFWYLLLAFILTLFTGLVVQSAQLDPDGLHYTFSPWIGLLAGPGYVFTLFSIRELALGFRQTQDSTQRNRFRYLIIGLAIIPLASLINWTPLGKYPIDIAANGITALLIGYTLFRHNLLDIHVVVRKGLFYTVLTSFIAVLYYLVISLTLNLLNLQSNPQLFLFSALVAMLSAIILSPLRNLAQSWVDRLFYREKYNAGLMLQRLSQQTTLLLPLEQLTQEILFEITRTLHVKSAAIFIKQEGLGSFRIMLKDEAKEFSDMGISRDHPVVTWLSGDVDVLTRHEISINPLFMSLWGNEKEALEKFGAELFIAIKAKRELVGFILVGEKLSATPYSHDDQLILVTVANQMAVAIENARLFTEMEDALLQTVDALATVIDLRDTYTITHSRQIATFAAHIARRLNCSADEVSAIYWGGLLHDIGKIGIPDAILLKPTLLDKKEWEIIHKHPEIGAHLVYQIKKLSNVAPIVLHSHERYDGKGYPHSLKGEEIPLGARIVAVVDAYSAMITDRVYRSAMSIKDAIQELKRYSGTQFDRKVVDVFIDYLDKESPK